MQASSAYSRGRLISRKLSVERLESDQCITADSKTPQYSRKLVAEEIVLLCSNDRVSHEFNIARLR
jgi:hypothetical protein